ncbi:MAG: DUF2306 domain-containing protein [Rhizobiaceae bacterium]|nr:DUF2306 domain-containing protein [Rhizobiaceae bacterium]
MNFEPLLTASPAIQIHVCAAAAAFLMGAAILFRHKAGPWHRYLGRTWVALMVVVAVSSFFIHTIKTWGIWSPIHLISVGTFFSLGYGLWLIRRRIVNGHRNVMIGTYFGAMVIAGGLSFLPGRIMYEVFFSGPNPAAGVTLIAAIVLVSGLLAWPGLSGTSLKRPAPMPRLLPPPSATAGKGPS